MDAAFLATLTPEEAAPEWLIARDRGLTSAEEELLAEWLAASADNRVAWAHAERMWSAFDATPDPLLASMRNSALQMRPPVHQRRGARIVAVAASLLLCIGVAGWQLDRFPHSEPGQNVAFAEPLILTTGLARKQISLADGSHVLLDAESRLRVWERRNSRDLVLDRGRAYFEVAHDASRPFTVTAQQHAVVATGTAFSVSARPGVVAVVLAEGRVHITGPSGDRDQADLRPGQVYEAEGHEIGTVSAADPDAALAWRTGFLDLEDVTIAEAVVDMNRYAKVPLSVGDAAAGALRITGRFRTDDAARFARTLGEIAPVELHRRPDGGFEIRSRKSIRPKR